MFSKNAVKADTHHTINILKNYQGKASRSFQPQVMANLIPEGKTVIAENFAGVLVLQVSRGETIIDFGTTNTLLLLAAAALIIGLLLSARVLFKPFRQPAAKNLAAVTNQGFAVSSAEVEFVRKHATQSSGSSTC